MCALVHIRCLCVCISSLQMLGSRIIGISKDNTVLVQGNYGGVGLVGIAIAGGFMVSTSPLGYFL